MSERPCPRTWTCQVRMRGDRLPDLQALARHILDIRVGASLRGVEATLEGVVAHDGQALVLRGREGRESLLLAPLTRKVQWDAAAGRDEPATDEERRAHDRLRARCASGTVRARLVGPLREAADGGLRMLEVRSFVVQG